MHSQTSRIPRLRCRRWRAAGALAVTLALLFPAASVCGQTTAPKPTPAKEPVPTEQARVPTSYANVHKGPSSGQVVLVLVPKGTVMPIIGRRGEWVQVRLAPEFRRTGMLMRWYEKEESGWMHDSTVEITKLKQP